MQILNMIFFKVLTMSTTASIVIVVVMLARFLMKRLPKKYSYMLWALVAFRLICPMSIGSEMSIFNVGIDTNKIEDLLVAEYKADNLLADGYIPSQELYNSSLLYSSEDYGRQAGNFLVKLSISMQNHENITATKSKTINRLAWIWLVGMVTLVSYFIIECMKLRRKVQYAVLLEDNVYECDNIASPFVFGIVCPKIYIPFRLSQSEKDCILMHERYHIKKMDYLIKNGAYLLACIYWFNPLVWLALHLMGCDMEMRCDENAISILGTGSKKDYSSTLLAFALNKRQYPISLLSFGEGNVSKRVKNILGYQKPSRIKIAAGIAVIAIVTAACATDGASATDKNTEENEKEVEFCGLYITEHDSIDGLNNIGPRLHLAQDNQFVFTENIFSSYLGVGTYTIENQIVTAKTDDGKYTYVFHILEDGSLLFDVDKSAEILVMKEDLKNLVTLDTDTLFTKTNDISFDTVE